MTQCRLIPITCVALLILLGADARALDLVAGYTITPNDPEQLGSSFIINQAATGGGDASAGNGFFNWVAQYNNMWTVGTPVSITGLAIPIQGTVSQNGNWTFSFFELDGGARPNAFDGYFFDPMNGTSQETLIGSKTAAFSGNGTTGTDEYFLQFDTPIEFTAASTGFALHMQSSAAIQVKTRPAGLAASRGVRVNLNTGVPVVDVNPNFRATFAGTPVALAPPVLPFRFDASTDTPGNDVWTPVTPSFESLTFGANASPVAVNDPSVPGITAAYDVPAVGASDIFETTINGAQASRQNGSFEVWFKPDSLTGGDQVVYEFGGSGSGGYFSLQGDSLSFFVKSQFDGSDQTLSTTLGPDAEWTQVVGVIHNTYEADPNIVSDDDFIDLYINGQLVSTTSASRTDINDWAGANVSGLGQDGQTIATGGPISAADNATVSGDFPFAGQIAILEYTPQALTAQQVMDRYLAITTPPAGTPGDYNGDGAVDAADYTVWRDNEGGDASVAFAAGSRDPGAMGVIGAGDYTFWKNQFGAPAFGAVGGDPVPEPTALVGLLLSLGMGLGMASACRTKLRG